MVPPDRLARPQAGKPSACSWRRSLPHDWTGAAEPASSARPSGRRTRGDERHRGNQRLATALLLFLGWGHGGGAVTCRCLRRYPRWRGSNFCQALATSAESPAHTPTRRPRGTFPPPFSIPAKNLLQRFGGRPRRRSPYASPGRTRPPYAPPQPSKRVEHPRIPFLEGPEIFTRNVWNVWKVCPSERFILLETRLKP